jgi:hypothetical protein
MRQVFSSPRLENVEGVAQMLREAGIDIKVTDARGYKQVSRREFSYVPSQQERSGTQPAVWVINADDYKRARDMLVDGGLLDEAKTSVSYLPEPLQLKEQAPSEPASARIGRVRIALLFIVGALAFWTILRMTVLR